MTRVERERMLGAVLFFARSTGGCTGHKLFRLLYLLDVLHVQQTGTAVTGLTYSAYTPGPVAVELSSVLEEPPPDLALLIYSQHEDVEEKRRHRVFARPEVAWDDGPFTPRQLRIMDALMLRYRDIRAEAIDVSDYDNGAWQRTLKRGRLEVIDLRESIGADDEYREEKIRIAGDRARRIQYLSSVQ